MQGLEFRADQQLIFWRFQIFPSSVNYRSNWDRGIFIFTLLQLMCIFPLGWLMLLRSAVNCLEKIYSVILKSTAGHETLGDRSKMFALSLSKYFCPLLGPVVLFSLSFYTVAAVYIVMDGLRLIISNFYCWICLSVHLVAAWTHTSSSLLFVTRLRLSELVMPNAWKQCKPMKSMTAAAHVGSLRYSLGTLGNELDFRV